MKTVSIRFEDDVFKKIEQLRGVKSKSDFCREIIEDSINHIEDVSLQNEDRNLQIMYEKLHSEHLTLKTESEHLREVIRLRDDLVKNLQDQNGFLIKEHDRLTRLTDKLLLPAAPAEPVKKWWNFWK